MQELDAAYQSLVTATQFRRYPDDEYDKILLADVSGFYGVRDKVAGA